MGGTSTSSQKQSSSSALAPYTAASTGMDGILGSLSSFAPGAATLDPTSAGAIDKVIANSNSQPNYNPSINSGTLGLLNGGGAKDTNAGISSNLTSFNDRMAPVADGGAMGSNPGLKPYLDSMAADIRDQVNGSWAAAGRDGSPGNSQALGRGIATGLAPVIASQYNADTARKDAAAGNVYAAGNSTYGMLNQNQNAANTNFTNGVAGVTTGLAAENAGATAEINAAAQRFGIPVSQLTTLLGSISPVAAQFGTQSGSSTTEGSQTMSPVQQMAMMMQGIGSMMPKGPISFG